MISQKLEEIYSWGDKNMSYLQQIQATVQQMAEAISSVLGMEVTIVDDTLERVAGTGYHHATIGVKIPGKSVYHRVIQHAEEYIITDVTTFDDCGTCDKRSTCKELAQLCCPIIVGTDVIGVIGLIAFSPDRQSELSSKNERLLTFIRKMAELIAVKAAEKASLNRLMLVKNQLETVLNFITEGVIAIDHTTRIININDAAERMLRVKAGDILGFNINEVFPGTPIPEVLRNGVGFQNREVSIWQKGKHHHYLINARPMMVDGTIQGVVASFRTVEEGRDTYMVSDKMTSFENIIGKSKPLFSAKAEARKAAATTSTVLITGESGTGKELFARAIHSESDRNMKPFVAVNCAAIPESLLESELFGYEEGSFTGARKGGKPGKFQLADRGTIFLDEIGDMPQHLQAKILRVLQEKTIERVGGVKVIPIDVRVIAATNRDLDDMVRRERFREDLYYRLNVYPLMLPALRDRPEDIIELAEFFLEKYSTAYVSEAQSLSTEVIDILLNYKWPGNIRELENVVECAVVRATGTHIEVQDLPAKLKSCLSEYVQDSNQNDSERQAILKAIETFGASVEGKRQAAASLGMAIATLYRKMRKYKL